MQITEFDETNIARLHEIFEVAKYEHSPSDLKMMAGAKFLKSPEYMRNKPELVLNILGNKLSRMLVGNSDLHGLQNYLHISIEKIYSDRYFKDQAYFDDVDTFFSRILPIKSRTEFVCTLIKSKGEKEYIYAQYLENRSAHKTADCGSEASY